jgi:hypothetical protein
MPISIQDNIFRFKILMCNPALVKMGEQNIFGIQKFKTGIMRHFCIVFSFVLNLSWGHLGI